MFYVTYNIQSFTTLLLLAGGFKGLVFYVTFNNVSAIYHSFAVGRRFRMLMFYDTFNNVSVIYHTFTVGSGFRRLMFYATFNNVSVIYQSFAVAVGSGGSCLLPLSIMFQSSTTPPL